jgi:hypothetical protein
MIGITGDSEKQHWQEKELLEQGYWSPEVYYIYQTGTWQVAAKEAEA